MPTTKSIYLANVLLITLLASVINPATVSISATTLNGSVAVVSYEQGLEIQEPQLTVSNDLPGKQWAITKIMAPQAWEVTSGEPEILIAVLDTGIDKNQKDLSGKVEAEVNFTNSDTVEDVYGHGTHIAGIIAAWANNETGVNGLAPDCRLLNVKVADDQGRFDSKVVARGVIWAADHGARVINMSLVSLEPSSDLEEAINYAWSKGAVIVAAAGNLVGDKTVYPAYYSRCIAVAATDSSDCIASWSSQEEWVDVAAPGVDIYSTLPENKYGYKSGTSMAAAHVSGVAGLLFALEKDADGDGFINDEVRYALEKGCDGLDVSALKGRINAYHAVNSALTSK